MAEGDTKGTGANPAGANPGGSADSTPFMLDAKVPLPFGGGINLAPVVSTAQTNVSAGNLVAAFGKHDVQVEIDTLVEFTKKIDALLLVMEGSAAAPYQVQEQKLEGQHLASATFVEATDLTAAYGKVHAELVKLHKDFVSQIQAMKDAVSTTAGHYTTNENHTVAAQKAVAKGADAAAPKRSGIDY
ncbi:hypothetical protein [Kitasatospora sp. NPDC059599]|uniref:hypothetical protein n=1 Tax=Kitasatospora sp. NPDC059599 TaxID=3346880 RepID=UPI00369D92E5